MTVVDGIAALTRRILEDDPPASDAARRRIFAMVAVAANRSLKNPRHRSPYGLLIVATLTAALLSLAPARADSRPVVLETEPLQRGKAFACRIPVQVRYEGNVPLGSIRVIAKAYDGDEELASTGVSSGTAIIPHLSGNVVQYDSVPMQFDLSEDMCDRVDGLRIDFARCVFGAGPAENCLDQIRFARAPLQRPLYLAVKQKTAR